jgi:hypothetical protein
VPKAIPVRCLSTPPPAPTRCTPVVLEVKA